MNKLFYALVALVGACIFFSSCEKEGIGNNDNIIGTWVCVKATEVLEDGTVNTASNLDDVPLQMIFYKDGNCRTVGTDDELLDAIPYPYYIEDGVLHIMLESYYIKTLTNRKLVLEATPEYINFVNVFLEIAEEPRIKSLTCEFKKQ